jgi:3alpha(or 20beta)-hydroxysteroid dehydrogenase
MENLVGKLTGRVAIITGAAQGMGEAHARRFIKEGAQVALTDINSEGGEMLSKELGPNARFFTHDVADLADWKRVVSEVDEAFGTPTVLVNNAGIIGPVAETTELSEEDYLRIVAVNQHSQFYGMKTVIPYMQLAGGGSIVNISSTAGMISVVGSPNLAYVGSKFASRGMTKHVALQYGPDQIRVNSVHPGYILTPMMVAATDENGGGVGEAVPLRRLADPDEVSSLVLFLASDDSSYISGTEHVIDGGLIAG